MALISLVPKEPQDPISYDHTINYYIFPDVSDSSFVSSIEKLRLAAARRLRQMTDVTIDIISKLYASASNPCSLLYADGHPSIFDFRNGQFILDSTLYIKQCAFLKAIRMLLL